MPFLQVLQRSSSKCFVSTTAVIGVLLVITGMVRQDWRESDDGEQLLLNLPAAAAGGYSMQVRAETTFPIGDLLLTNDSDTKFIWLLAYQRTGSSFISEIFDSSLDSFFMFEPVDSLYSALYGTMPGWNIPSDIVTYSNGQPRIPPKSEVNAVTAFVGKLFLCDVDSWPTETLAHPFWSKFLNAVNIKYAGCLKDNNLTISRCSSLTSRYCGGPVGRFGDQPQSRLNQCNRLLWNDAYRNEFKSTNIGRMFIEYKQCTDNLRSKIVDLCLPHLRTACRSRRIRVIKTVRATMDSVEPLMKAFPNLYVIHLLRDPRGVARSRALFDNSGRSVYSTKLEVDTLIAEAAIYCRTAVHDILKRRQLASSYPNRIYTVHYDKLVKDIRQFTKNLYHFINEWRIHQRTARWLQNKMASRNRSSDLAGKWRSTLTSEQYAKVSVACSKMLSLM